jgi:hypothetical protein
MPLVNEVGASKLNSNGAALPSVNRLRPVENQKQRVKFSHSRAGGNPLTPVLQDSKPRL